METSKNTRWIVDGGGGLSKREIYQFNPVFIASISKAASPLEF